MMPRDEQSAGSRRYVEGLIVLALPSGAWAIYSRHGDVLHGILPSLAGNEGLLREWQAEGERTGARARMGKIVEKTLEEMGL